MKTNYLLILTLFFSFPVMTSAASYEEGRDAYLAKDYEKALSILVPKAKKGHAKSQVTLGTMYDFGHGVEKDTAKAVEWFEKAAAQGNSFVQHDLGVKYFKGIGITQDYDKAAAWWRMAADNGVAESQYNLGLMYARGLGFEQDSGKAVQWYSKAASQGHANAQYSLGVMYSFGQGVPQDYEKGISYFQDAAEQDLAQAQYNLAVLLENGRGTDVDLEGAKKWYQRASAGGIEQATQRLASFEEANETTTAKPSPEVEQPKTTVVVKKAETKPQATTVTEVTAEKKVADEVVKKEIVSTKAVEELPEPAKMEKLTIPETEISQDKAPKTLALNKAAPENHQVISGTVIEQGIQSLQKQAVKKKLPKVKATVPAKKPKKLTPKIAKQTSPAARDEHEAWIRSQDPGHYALQMIAFNKKEYAQRYIDKLELEGDKAVYKSTMHGRVIYKVIYGNFDNHKESLRGRRALPTKYRNAKPFPRSFEFIQNDIRE